MAEKLTKAQKRMLQAAQRGGVLGFGVTKLTQDNLRRRGFLTRARDGLGYYNITDAGRAALREMESAK